MIQLQLSFWGPQDGATPTCLERGNKCKEILKAAHDQHSNESNPMKRFMFKIGKQQVCEYAFAKVLGNFFVSKVVVTSFYVMIFV
jgi:hypothetical protein